VCQTKQRPYDHFDWQKLGYHFKDRVLTMPCYLTHQSCSRFETAVFFFIFLHSTYARYTSRAGWWTWKIFDKMFVATHSEAMLWRGFLLHAPSQFLCVRIGMTT
jgi:membrane protease YdiL (CAAX protease family)